MPGIGTRSWLPPILAEPDDWFGADDDPWGAAARPEPIGTAPATAAVPAAQPGAAPAETGGGEPFHGAAATPYGSAAGDSGSAGQDFASPHAAHFGKIKLSVEFTSAKLHEGHGGHLHHGGHPNGHPSAEGDGDAETTPAHADGDGVGPAGSDAALFAPAGAEDADGSSSITVTQYAEVTQDASIEVSGYVGDVVTRLYIDQDLSMDQDVDIDFTIDGNGRFSARIDQDTHIDQAIEVDVKIADTDGVLYLDVYLKDAVTVDQTTGLDLHIGDGDPGGSVAIDQGIDLDQDVDIDLEIEDDLALRYKVDVSVDVEQAVQTTQTADVDIKDWHGAIEMDVEATQIALIEQQTAVHADFHLV